MQKIVPIDCIVCKAHATKKHPPAEAAVIARVHGGCVVVANVIQPLCEQHLITCTPLGKGGATVEIELGKLQNGRNIRNS